MKSVGLILGFISIWIIFGGLLTLAIVYDGVYIQLVFDFGIMVLSGIIGYFAAKKTSKQE